MATHDYVISNASGAAVRADLNNALAAIVSNNSNATEPSTTYSYMLWADTGSSPPVMKLRNAANDGWVTLFQLDGEWSTLAVEDGTAAAPSIYFKDSGTDTGLFSSGTDEVAIATGGTQRATVDASGRLLVGTSTGTSVFDGVTPQFQIEGTGYNSSSASLFANSNDANGSYLVFGKSRGTSTGSSTIVSSGDAIGGMYWVGADGTDRNTPAASIYAFVDGTPGSNDMPGRLVFSTTADGASSPTERLRISNSGIFTAVSIYNNTTASAANLRIRSDGIFERSTSSVKYKTNVEDLQDFYADAILNIRPVWYRSTCPGDDSSHSWWGFLAEEVAEIDPRLVQWKTFEVSYDENGSAVNTPCEPEPDGVAYERFVPHLLNLIKRQKEQIEAMEARLSALEAS